MAHVMNIPESTLQEIRSVAASGNKIQAIKMVREHTGVGLAEAVSVLDWIMKDDPSAPMPATKPAQSGSPFPGVPGRGPSLTLPIVIFSAVGAILLAITAWLYFDEVAFRKTAVQVDGIVVENLPNRRSFTPVYEFQWKGEKRRVQSKVSSSVNNRPVYKTGEKLTLLVAPDDPDSAHPDTWFSSWFAPTVTGGLGTIFSLIGLGMLIFGRKKK